MRAAVIVVCLLAASAARADEPAIDPDAPSLRVLAMKDGQPALLPRVKVGEPFHLLVTVTPKPDVVVGMPVAFETGSFEVLERREIGEPGKLERSFDLTVVCWEPGRQKFPPVPITYIPKGKGQLQQVKTDEQEVEVVAVLPGEEQKVELRPIAPPVRIYAKDWTLVIIAAAAGGTLLAGAAILFMVRGFHRRRERALAAAPVVNLRPAHEIALEKLRALAQSPLLEESDRRPFYFAVTEVMRDFLGRRYGFAALDMTTSELMANLAAVTAEQRDVLERWFGGCDLVKFARVPASRDEALAKVHSAVSLVEASKPPAEPAPAVAGATDAR